MNKYLEAEKKLAELLGLAWTNHGAFPELHWTRDNAAAFNLMIEHGLDVDCASGDNVYVAYSLKKGYTYEPVPAASEEYANHPDHDAAVRYAIVMTVIAKLEKDRGG